MAGAAAAVILGIPGHASSIKSWIFALLWRRNHRRLMGGLHAICCNNLSETGSRRA